MKTSGNCLRSCTCIYYEWPSHLPNEYNYDTDNTIKSEAQSSQPPSFPITLSNFIVYKPPVFLTERWDEYIWCVKSHCLRRSDL